MHKILGHLPFWHNAVFLQPKLERLQTTVGLALLQRKTLEIIGVGEKILLSA
jgi:hypothetical protein